MIAVRLYFLASRRGDLQGEGGGLSAGRRFKDQLRDYDFPTIAAKAFLILGSDRSRSQVIMAKTVANAQAMPSGAWKLAASCSYNGAVLVQEFPTGGPQPDIQFFAGRQRGNGAMHRISRKLYPPKLRKTSPRSRR